MRRPVDDDGAVLLLVLVLVTAFSLVAVAVLRFGTTTAAATTAEADRTRLVAALGVGIDAAVGDLTDTGVAVHSLTCDGATPLQVSDASGPARDGSDGSVPILVKVTCTDITTPVAAKQLVAVGYSGAAPLAPALCVRIVTTAPGSTKTTSWRLVDDTASCTEVP